LLRLGHLLGLLGVAGLDLLQGLLKSLELVLVLCPGFLDILLLLHVRLEICLVPL
jgi:hypothetical protein